MDCDSFIPFCTMTEQEKEALIQRVRLSRATTKETSPKRAQQAKEKKANRSKGMSLLDSVDVKLIEKIIQEKKKNATNGNQGRK